MKQKLPEDRSLDKNLYSSGIGKTKNLKSSWEKFSLMGLLITIFFEKNTNLSHFQILLPNYLWDSKKNKKKLSNSLMLFVLPIFFLIYRSNTTNLTEITNLTLTRIHKQNRFGKNYIDIYKKSIQNFNKNCDISLKNILKQKQFSAYESLNLLYHERTTSKFSLTLENFLSDAIWKFSRYLIYQTRESKIERKYKNLWTSKIHKNINFTHHEYDDTKSVQKDIHFLHSKQQLSYLYYDHYMFDWMTKMVYSKHRSDSKMGFYKQTFVNKSLLTIRKNGLNGNFNLSKKSRIGESVLTHFFSEPKMKKVNLNFFLFIEPFLINECIQNMASSEIFNIFPKKLKEDNWLRKKSSESDDFKIISLKGNKYHSNVLKDSFFPFNRSYKNIIFQNSIGNQIQYEVKEKYTQFFFKGLNLLSLSKVTKLFSFITYLKLKKKLLIKNNDSYIVIHRLNKNQKDSNFIKQILNLGKYSNISTLENESKTSYSYYSCNNLLKKTLPKKVLGLQKIYKNNVLHKYSKFWNFFLKKTLIYNVENVNSQKLSIKISNWLFDRKGSSKPLVFSNFFLKLEFIKELNKFFQTLDSKNIYNIFNLLQVPINVCNGNLKQNKLLIQNLIKKNEFEDLHMKNLIKNSIIDEITDNEIDIDFSNKFLYKNQILSDWIINKRLFSDSNYKYNFDNFLMNFNSDSEKKFWFYQRGKNTKKKNILYSQLLKIFSKYDGLKRIYIKTNKQKIFQFIQLKLNKLSKLDEVSVYNFQNWMKKQTRLHFPIDSNSYFIQKEGKKLEIVFSNKDFKIKEIETSFFVDFNEMKVKEYYTILQSESFNWKIKANNLIFRLINNIYLSPIFKYTKFRRLKSKVEPKITDKIYESNPIQNFYFSQTNSFIRNDKSIYWIFTSEWWEYNLQSFGKLLQKVFKIIISYSEYFIIQNDQIIKKNFGYFYNEKINLYTLDSKWNSRLFFDEIEEDTLNLSYSYLDLKSNFSSLQWVILFCSITFILLFSQNIFSILIGSDSIELWQLFEKMKSLIDPSRAFYFTELLHRSKKQFNGTENPFISLFNNLKHYGKNIQFYLLTKKNLKNWLITNKSLDISRRNRNLLVQSLITPTRIKEYGFQWYSQPKIKNNYLFFGHQKTSQQGLSYLQYIKKMFEKRLFSYSPYLADKWIFFASIQKMISSKIYQQTEKINPKFYKTPISLQLGLSCSKGILLIGPVESGRSYLIKNLASDSSIPLLGISINKLLYNKPDVATESWMNILLESLRRLTLTLDLAKGMSPCIIWVRNIHELDVNRATQNIESDPTFLLGILLKHFQNSSTEGLTKQNTLMIGSTHVSKKVDPSFISPERLDKVLNIRSLNTYQRINKFPILLKKNNLRLNKNLSYSDEFVSRTLGYNIRDFAFLTNEISLISLVKNQSVVYDDVVKLAFHRQIFGFSHTNNKPNYRENLKILIYKIGRAIIQNIMVEGLNTNPLNISNFLWKKKFYYLSKWYLEPSVNDSIIKESTILVHVLVCLAGIAARDSWFLLSKESHTSISFDKLIENDLDLAASILESFFDDFPWLETCEKQSTNYKKKKPKISLTNNFLNIMHGGISAVTNKDSLNPRDNSQEESLLSKNKIHNQKIDEFKKTKWSPRFWRLNFIRSHLFNWVKRPNNFEFFHTVEFSGKNTVKRKNQDNQSIDRKNKLLFYERILPRVRKRNVEELEHQFENILLEEQFEILGFFQSSTQYQMEYHQLNGRPKLFIGKRILWDPISSLSRNRHFVFSRRNFFIDDEMLRRLYITYGVRRERERSLSSHKIKRFFIRRGYNKDLINKLSVRWWNQLPMGDEQNIYALNRINKIGIRLKRPQIFTPVYIYQRWLLENVPEKISRLDLVTHRDRWNKINQLFLNDSFIHHILLESYQYLFEFFLSNKTLLTQMTKILLKKKWIFQNDIVTIINGKGIRNIDNRR